MSTITSYAQGTPCYVELQTPDQHAAKAFYGALFGWTGEDAPLDDEGHYYVRAALQGDVVAGIAGQMPELADHPAFWGVYLAVDDVDASAAKVAQAGGTVEAGPFDVAEHGRMAAIKDPTAARVNLWQANKHVGSGRVNEPGAPIWNELTTPDIATATKFYADVLGVAWEAMPMEGGEYTCLMIDGRPVGGASAPMMEGVPPHWNVYFNVEDVDATLVQAEELGGRVMVPAFDAAGVGRMAFLSDPQGAMFALMASASTDGS